MSLKKLKKAELVEIADENEIDVDGLNKSEIVELLESEGIELKNGGDSFDVVSAIENDELADECESFQSIPGETKADRQARLRAR